MGTAIPAHGRAWLDQIFAAKAAEGQVVRRGVSWAANEIGVARFVTEVRARGFHLIQTGDRFEVVCHRGEIRLLF